MSQDTSTHDTSTGESRRPTGTEDLLPGRGQQERTDEDAMPREEDRLDEAASVSEEQGYDEPTDQGTSMDGSTDTAMDTDLIAEDRVDGELGDVDQSQFQASPSTGRPPAAAGGYDQATPLFGASDVEGFRSRWIDLQAAFVDDPRTAVQQADQLVAEVMQTLAEMFNANKHELEGQWQREGTADTEDLRQALRRYRGFFDQLLRS